MNDAEIRARVDVGDGGGFLRLGNSIKQVDKQAMFLKTRINDIKQTLAKADMGFDVGDTMKLEAELEKIQNQYNGLYAVNEKTTNSVSKGWEKGTKNIGRFLFNMFAVGSVFALVAKASRSYLETNDEAQAQTEITANTMGQLLAPAMKVVLDLTQYLVIGFALLIKMFTGYDALAKVTTKSIKKTSDATKDLNKQLTSMDEIQNLQDPNGGAGLIGLQADLNALDDFSKKIETVQALFDKWDIQSFVNKLKDLWKWLTDNKDKVKELGIELGIIFGVAKIGGWLLQIKSLIGTAGTGAAAAGGSGLAGLLGVLLAIMAIGTIVTTIKTIYQEIREGLGAAESTKNIATSTGKVGAKQAESMKQAEEESKKAYINQLQEQLKASAESAAEAKKRYMEAKSNIDLFNLTASFANIAMQKKLFEAEDTNAQNRRNEIKTLGGVPKYANGGVVTKATLGISGEYSGASSNPEIISPQSLMKDTMIEAFSQILPMMNQSRGDAILNVNGRDLARATFGDFEYEGNRLGKTSTVVRRVV